MPRTQIRAAFSLLEIVIAIVFLTTGLLGYAALSANLARAHLFDLRRARSAELLETRQETLLRQGCAAAASGSELRFGMPVEWSVRPGTGNTKSLTVVVTRTGVQGPRMDSLTAVIPCE